MISGKPLVVNGWTLFAHPIFLDQLEALTTQVKALQRKDPAGYVKKNAAKRLAAIAKLAFEVIPQDPARPDYRQGSTLGDENKHWFRAKFFQQYSLFFRYHAQAKGSCSPGSATRTQSGPMTARTTPTACFAECSTTAGRRRIGTIC